MIFGNLRENISSSLLGDWACWSCSMSRILQFLVIWGADVVSFGAQNMSCGMPVVSTLTPWRQSNDPRELGSTRRRTLGSGLGFLLILNGIRDRILIAFVKNQAASVFLLCFFPSSRCLMISGSESGRLRLQNQACGGRGVAKNNMFGFFRCWY